MRFRYSALTPAGQSVSGTLDMPNAAAAVSHLQLQGLLPIEAVEASSKFQGQANRRGANGRFLPGADLVLVARQLSRLAEAGLPFDRSLQIITGLLRRRRSREVLEIVLARVCDGESLADAMSGRNGAFPTVMIAMVRAGEQGGIAGEVLRRAADFLERTEAVRQKVFSALIYPAILGAVACLATVIVLTVVLPEFEPIFQEAGARLPLITRLVMAAGRTFRAMWWLIPVGVCLLVLIWRLAMRHPRYQWMLSQWVLKIPLLGSLVIRTDAARFSRTLSTLLANGVPAERALHLGTGVVTNRVLAGALNTATEQLRRGEGLSGPLQRAGLLPDLLIQLVRVGEEAGKLPDLLSEAAGILEAESQRDMDRLLAFLVPGLTIGMGTVIATIIAAVLLAMLSINDITG